jgi:hypothetical protein
MAKRVYSIDTITPTAFADTTSLTNGAYVGAFKGGSSTQRTKISEIYIGGQATASAPTFLQLARDSTVGVGSQTGGDDAPLDPATAALGAPVGVGNSFATSAPQRDAAAKLLHLDFNAFGGIVRWKSLAADESDCPVLLGNTASFGEASLSAFTGGTPGALGAHVIYETL